MIDTLHLATILVSILEGGRWWSFPSPEMADAHTARRAHTRHTPLGRARCMRATLASRESEMTTNTRPR